MEQFQELSISSDGRFILNKDGSPFFYLADTAWELFHKLSREDADEYLRNRAEKGFTAVQAVALAELDGLYTPNAHGRLPFLFYKDGTLDPAAPDLMPPYSYWDHVDYILKKAAEYGLYIAFLPTWGDKWNRLWGKGPEILDPETAENFGNFIGTRYGGYQNIIWVLGGDRPLQTRRHFETICALARGIKKSESRPHLMTLHPTGGHSSSEAVHEEPWLDFNMIQSGHSRSRFNYEMISKDRQLLPAKPVLDGEPGYEDHPESFDIARGYMDAADVRQFAYMSVFSGACGHTYGDHSIWSMVGDVREMPDFRRGHFALNWKQALNSPGSFQMKYLKDLVLSHDFLKLKPASEAVEEQLPGVLHIPVLKSERVLLAYISQGQEIRLKADQLPKGPLTFSWFDPRTGCYSEKTQARPGDLLSLLPPSGGRGNDWVLVIEAV